MSMEQQQPKAEDPGPGPGSLGGDRSPITRNDLKHELERIGLLDYAAEIGFERLSDDPGAGNLNLPRPSPVGFNNPPPQPTNPLELRQCMLANQATDMATTRATQTLQLARISLHKLTTSYNPRAAGSGGTDNSSKRRKTSRGADAGTSRSGSKGLRHFSMKVCEKVEAKVRTTYNEVADELVEEMGKIEAANKNGQYDEKNIRRRVYDAINVLMAMNIIQKEKKEITWKGFPKLGSSALERLKADRVAKIKEVEAKQAYLQDLIEQQMALKKLLERSNQRGLNPGGTQLFLPFILIQAKQEAQVEVKISEDLQDVQFEFGDSPFQIHDDSHVLRKMAEHQAKQQPQPQPFPNPLAGGLGLPWAPPNGAPTNFLTDAALAQLAAAAAVQAPGGLYAYGYPPHAAAAAALYQQQHLLHQQAQQAGQAPGPLGQGPAAAAVGAAGQPGQAAAGQGQEQAGPPGGVAAQGQTPPHLQHTLQALQAQLQQQQQLQAQLQLQAQAQQQVRGGLPPLALPPLGHAMGPGGPGAAGQPVFGLPHHPPPLLPPQLPHQVRMGLPPLPSLPQGQPLAAGPLLPIPQLPANLAAALNTAAQPPGAVAAAAQPPQHQAPPPPQQQQQSGATATAQPPAQQAPTQPAGNSGGGAAAPAQEANGAVGTVAAPLAGLPLQPPATHGLPLPQLVAPAPAAAFSLVA